MADATRVARVPGLELEPGTAVVVVGGDGGSARQACRRGEGTAGLFAWKLRRRVGVVGGAEVPFTCGAGCDVAADELADEVDAWFSCEVSLPLVVEVMAPVSFRSDLPPGSSVRRFFPFASGLSAGARSSTIEDFDLGVPNPGEAYRFCGLRGLALAAPFHLYTPFGFLLSILGGRGGFVDGPGTGGAGLVEKRKGSRFSSSSGLGLSMLLSGVHDKR